MITRFYPCILGYCSEREYTPTGATNAERISDAATFAKTQTEPPKYCGARTIEEIHAAADFILAELT